jgi:hypothetical protein
MSLKKIDIIGNIYNNVIKGVNEGNNLIMLQGSARSGKTYNVMIFLIQCAISQKVLISVVRLALPSLKRSVFRDFIEIMCNMGIYVTCDMVLPAGMMIDRALLAQSIIKGSYTAKVSYYQESLRAAMLTEQDILAIAGTALEEKQFVLYYQPQYNHTDGTIIGAEALVRWKHPDRGLISPGIFIPIFEKNGYILNSKKFPRRNKTWIPKHFFSCPTAFICFPLILTGRITAASSTPPARSPLLPCSFP